MSDREKLSGFGAEPHNEEREVSPRDRWMAVFEALNEATDRPDVAWDLLRHALKQPAVVLEPDNPIADAFAKYQLLEDAGQKALEGATDEVALALNSRRGENEQRKNRFKKKHNLRGEETTVFQHSGRIISGRKDVTPPGLPGTRSALRRQIPPGAGNIS